MSNKLQLLKSLLRHVPQTIRLIYVLSSMYFVLRLIDLEPDKRLYAIETIHLLISGVFTIGNIKELLSNNVSDNVDGDEQLWNNKILSIRYKFFDFDLKVELS